MAIYNALNVADSIAAHNEVRLDRDADLEIVFLAEPEDAHGDAIYARLTRAGRHWVLRWGVARRRGDFVAVR